MLQHNRQQSAFGRIREKTSVKAIRFDTCGKTEQKRSFFSWRREGDSNPRFGINRTTDFESVTFDHSDISARFSIINIFLKVFNLFQLQSLFLMKNLGDCQIFVNSIKFDY